MFNVVLRLWFVFTGGGSTTGSSSSTYRPPSGDVIVLGLKWDVTEDDLRAYFTQFGTVEHAEVCIRPVGVAVGVAVGVVICNVN